VPADPLPVSHGRLAGAALLLSCLLLLGFAAALVVEDRSAVTTLLLVFAIVSVPALLSAVFGLRAGFGLLRGQPPEKSAAGFAGLLAVGHLGIVALSLRPGLDRRLDDGDLAGGTVGAVGMLTALVALAVVVPWRTVGVRLAAALGGGVLLLALVVLRAVSQLD
jgi:hypothetical protein